MATFLVGVASALGLSKFYLEPRQAGSALRRKYGTALWIACKELKVHLAQIQEKLANEHEKDFHSLLKIPANDWGGHADWFLKDGFDTTVTAHKIAVLSAWLYVYQQELLFSRTRESSLLLADLYNHAGSVRKAFSENSCFWPEYFDAIGSQYVERVGDSYRPIPLSTYCFRCASDPAFLMFYDQLHNFIHLTAKDERARTRAVPPGEGRIDRIVASLDSLMHLIERKSLLAGLQPDQLG